MTQREDVTERILKFARLYCDPTSPTFQDGPASYKALVPDASDAAANKAADRYMDDERFKAEELRITEATRTVSALTPAEYISKCLANEERLLLLAEGAEKGAGGIASAAAKYRELAGKAAGLLITKFEDLTPKERKLPSTEQMKGLLKDTLEQMMELDKPLPATAQLAAPTPASAEPDYETVSDGSN